VNTATTTTAIADPAMRPLPPAGRAPDVRHATADTGPLVSVIMPAYNVEPYIETALISALDQTYRHLEVIVVNDGSTDGTRAVIDRVARQRQDERLRVIDRANGGLSAARNTGIASARGELLGFLDSDDAWRTDKLELHVRLLVDDTTLGLTFSYSDYMTEAGRLTGTRLRTTRHEPTLHDMLRRNHCGNGSTVVMRRECFELAGTFREDLKSCEDYELWCRVLWATGFKAACVQQPLTIYRLRDSSLSFNFQKFTDNADLAMRYLRQAMPHVPARRFRAGHAEHYRIVAWKAATIGRNREAAVLLARALRLWPWLLLTDFHAAATALLLAVPLRLRGPLVKRAKGLLGSGSSGIGISGKAG
jgi:glycosyltransferase involved in cell wall biosynthesis